ncbi:MAG: Farnesyl diphosphate synthase [Fimbriimonadaceae bacterium]|nr:Farnesyl diphosphate synthase [Fimbriimonadaceae bacterium]
MTVEATLASWKQQVDASLDRILPRESEMPSRLHAAMRYSALAPGKRIRPLLAMASAVAVGGRAEDALEPGCALELVHAFSLIHDDLPAIDDDDLRRGRPTCHIEFGEGLAILAGDALFALAFEVTARTLPQTDAVTVLAEASGSYGLVGGEVIDIEGEKKLPSSDLVELIHRRKTGALIGASCVFGAIASGRLDLRPALAGIGMGIGLAFQIQDDILNATSTPEALGKSAGSDHARGKQTYPAVFGVDASRRAANDNLSQALNLIDSLPGNTQPLRILAQSAVDRSH